VEKARRGHSMLGLALAYLVTCTEPCWWSGAGRSETSAPGRDDLPLAVVMDFGVKYNTLRRLAVEGFRVRVVPARTTAAEILALDPAGVVLSNGPGDPEPLDFAVETARAVAAKVPTLGICLGHQLLGLAFGGRTSKLKFGHRGINHPVIHRPAGGVEVTSQNHGFTVEPDSLPGKDLDLSHWIGNDGTPEGFAHRGLPVLSCQYHPEASPGPHDSRPWFRAFSEEIGGTGGPAGRPPAEPEPLETPAGFSPEAPAELPAKASAGSPAKTPAGS